MMRRSAVLIADAAMLLRLSLRLQLGRWVWLVPAIALLWPAYQAITVLLASRQLNAADAQNGLIGMPLVVLAIGLGVRVIAAEIDQRTLEVAYTVPGGARRVWVAKLAAAAVPLLGTGLLLAIIAAVFLVRYPLSAL
jgi:ABC-type transport system involved in multi-copper enzyme maturation permease subunit